MKIYIEDQLILNFLVNLSLILIISSCLKLKTNKLKTIFACTLSSISSFLFVLNSNIILCYILDILLSLFILSFSFKNLNIKKFLQSLSLLFILSNSYSGLLNIFGFKFCFGIIAYNFVSSTICLVLLFVLASITTNLLKLIVTKQQIHNNICQVDIKFKNKIISTFGYFDTGNNLSFNTGPVSIVNYKLFQNLTDINLSNFLSKNFDLKDYNYINTSTLTGSKKLLMFTIDEMTIIKNKKKETIFNPQFALSLNLKNNNDYDIILNNNYI